MLNSILWGMDYVSTGTECYDITNATTGGTDSVCILQVPSSPSSH